MRYQHKGSINYSSCRKLFTGVKVNMKADRNEKLFKKGGEKAEL